MARLTIIGVTLKHHPSNITYDYLEDKMARYYINRNAQEDGYHEVHNGSTDCPHPPLHENRVNIGYYDTCSEAIKAARDANPTLLVDGCYYCTLCHTR